MQITLKRDVRNHVIRVLLFGKDDSREKKGLTAQSEGLCITYVRDDKHHQPVVITPVPGKAGSYAEGSLVEIDGENMPGLYELGLPAEICAEETHRAALMIRAAEIQTQVIHLDFVAYDPYDRDRLGLDCLSSEARHDVIARAFREIIPDIVEEFRRGSD